MLNKAFIHVECSDKKIHFMREKKRVMLCTLYDLVIRVSKRMQNAVFMLYI